MKTPKNRPPTHPGDILLKDFLEPTNITQVHFDKLLGGYTHALTKL